MYHPPFRVIKNFSFEDDAESLKRLNAEVNASTTQAGKDLAKSLDEEIFENFNRVAKVRLNVEVDEEEIVKLLTNDRQQYEKGYADGKAAVSGRLTPKKPNYEADGYADGELVYDIVECPNCDYDFEESIPNYCPNCGQAIDWTEVEE